MFLILPSRLSGMPAPVHDLSAAPYMLVLSQMCFLVLRAGSPGIRLLTLILIRPHSENESNWFRFFEPAVSGAE